MKTKNKLWWSLVSLALVLVVAATSVGITLAALQAQVNSSFSISYTAKNVKAGITGMYITPAMSTSWLSGQIHHLQGDDTVPILDQHALIFTGDETSNTKSFDDPGKIEIPTRKVQGLNNFVMFCYTFVNCDQTPLSVDLNFQKTSDDANIQVEFTSFRFLDMFAIMTADDYSSLGAEAQQKIEADLEKINTFLGNKEGLSDNLTIYDILHMISFEYIASYDEELEAIKQDSETLNTLIDLVNTYENALKYSQTFSTFEVPFCGYSLEQLMSSAVSSVTELDATCLFIKISLKNETVNVDNFGAEINFTLTPSAAA